MKNIIRVFILLLFIGATNSSASCDTSLRYALCKKNLKNIEVVPQANLYSLRFALTESATADFYHLTRNNIGKTLEIVFEDILVTGADIDAPIDTGLIFSIPATKEEANRLRQSILDNNNITPCGQVKQH